MDAAEVVRAWFDAFERSDMDAARAVFAADGRVHAGDLILVGFDAARDWFAEKARDHGSGFRYELVELLPGPRGDVAAVIELGTAAERWRQVAVYRIETGAIAEVRLYERAHAPSAA